MAASTDDVLQELDLQQPRIRDIFLRIIRRIVGAVRASQIVEAITARRTADIPAMFLKPGTLSPLVEAIRSTLAAGGETAAQALKPPGFGGAIIDFDMRNTAVESWIRNYGAELMQDIEIDQRAAIRAAIERGLAAGRNPRAIALDLIGRLGADGHRVGGIVGLTEQQTQYVLNARDELDNLSAAYFDRAARDKRFDSVVRRAIAGDRTLSQADIDRIIGRYADGLLQTRGEAIGRTEALAALNAGRDLAISQAIGAGSISAQNVTATWNTAHDAKVRETHREMQGQQVPYGGVFTTPSGAKLRYPGDSSLGAPASEIINCRCVAVYRVDWLAQGLGGGG